MTMGEKIKQCREELELSQEKLGELLNPPVNKAAINKWEKGTVENIKRTHIQQLARIFKISPCDLMCWEEVSQNVLQQPKVMTLTDELVQIFSELNKEGQEDVLKYLHYIASQEKYQSAKKESYTA